MDAWPQHTIVTSNLAAKATRSCQEISRLLSCTRGIRGSGPAKPGKGAFGPQSGVAVAHDCRFLSPENVQRSNAVRAIFLPFSVEKRDAFLALRRAKDV
jgi:hypothetical protein